jgi:acyl-CoA thioesterase-1
MPASAVTPPRAGAHACRCCCIQHSPTLVVIELGGNDALRGLPLQMTQDNLQAMTAAAQDAGAKVLLIGMQVPPNYGTGLRQPVCRDLFAKVAKANKAALVPFMLKGCGGRPGSPLRLFQARPHPPQREAAHPIMLNNLWPDHARN